MKKICAIFAMMAMMVIMPTGCRAQNEASTAEQSSSVQSSSVQSSSVLEETAENSEEEKDAVQFSENGTSSKLMAEEKREGKQAADEETGRTEDIMRLLIGETEVPVAWEENESVEALQDLCPLTIRMSMYGGFEQVGPIGQNIVREDQQTVTDSGDIVLYSGNQIVIFYGSNSWAYTRLGHIDLSEQEMGDLLSNGDVTITLE